MCIPKSVNQSYIANMHYLHVTGMMIGIPGSGKTTLYVSLSKGTSYLHFLKLKEHFSS